MFNLLALSFWAILFLASLGLLIASLCLFVWAVWPIRRKPRTYRQRTAAADVAREVWRTVDDV